MNKQSVNMGSFIAVAALGVIMGFLLSTAGSDPDNNAQLFASSGAYLFWRLLILAQTTLFAVAAIPLWQAVRTLWKSVDLRGQVAAFQSMVGWTLFNLRRFLQAR